MNVMKSTIDVLRVVGEHINLKMPISGLNFPKVEITFGTFNRSHGYFINWMHPYYDSLFKSCNQYKRKQFR